MVKTASLFSQLLQQVPRNEFAKLVSKHEGERAAKGFTCWAQFTAMLFCQLAHADSLREICNGLACCLGKLTHLGINRGPSKSNLSYANIHRPAVLFEDLFWTMTDRFRAQGHLGSRKHKFRFKNKLLSLDSTTISLCLSLFPWAEFRRAKGGVKAHVLLDHDDYMPSYVLISKAKMHDAKVLALLRLNTGSIVAMDRAYNDYKQFARWTESGVYFVTRMKENAVYEVVEARGLPLYRNILSDEIIVLTGAQAQNKCPHKLRRIVVWDADNEREIVLLTNHLDFGATTIADIYKERWQIELFFKALKQNLKIKSFVGTSDNALRIQIWTALLALLLLKWLHHLSKAGWSLSNLASMLRLNLFTYRNLRDWLDDPVQHTAHRTAARTTRTGPVMIRTA
ncbi:MAG TPA: IS4 family transposase [Candidatus Marinimicrobia bacterium]|nr:IS4 family transposase [Candidatus Neomarinimicrobiota bacterium]